MPSISEFYCINDAYGFELPHGWGRYMYAVTDDSERVRCHHPGEQARARAVIGADASEAKFDRRTGYNTHCFCLHCESQVDLDLERDEKACPECRSNYVKTISELVDETCPVCGEEAIVAHDTGAIA